MKTLLFILLIVCLAVQIPAWICCIIGKMFFSKETKKKINDETDEYMKTIYPAWPYVPRQKTDFASAPLSFWNDD